MEKPRTTRQSRAAHLWFEQLAGGLNDAGYSVTKVLKHDAEIPWTKVLVKELLFKKIVEAMYQKDSTTKLTTKELTHASEVLTRHLAEKLGVQIDFPSIDGFIE